MKNRKEKLMMLIEEYWRNELPDMFERNVDIDTESKFIVDIVGPRRAGKTYLMYLTIRNLMNRGVEKKQTIYVNFERRLLYPLSGEYFNDLAEIMYTENMFNDRIYLFLDEVQRVKGWEKYVRSLYDEFGERIKIFVSGSTSELTKSSLSMLLTGRHITRYLFSLNFREFLSFKNFKIPEIPTEKERIRIKRYLEEYIEYGGFPEVVLQKNKEYIENLFLDILMRDAAPKVKNTELLEDISYLLTSMAGRTVSFSKISNLLKSRGLKVSVPTLEKYFYIMKDAFLFHDNIIYSYKIKDQLQYPRKIYCIDTGFVNYFGFKFSEDHGRLMENLAAIELLRRYPKRKIFYWKDSSGEVDFVVTEGVKIKELIQVTYASGKDEIREREIKALKKAGEELKCKNLKVITWDYEDKEIVDSKRIVYTPLWKWLVEK